MTTKELTEEVKALRSRVSTMRDEVVSLQSQVTFMAERIQKDMVMLSERINTTVNSTNTTNYSGPR